MEHPRPIAAVFVLDVTRITSRLLAGWMAAGHGIATVVVRSRPHRRRGPLSQVLHRLFGRQSLRQKLEAQGVPVIEIDRSNDWTELLPALRAANAEVLICYAFPRKIPAEVLALFPFGGLNLHPALLPNYPGPFPLHRMILDDTFLVHGGMSLHRMSEQFDAGPVLAYARFSPEDWSSLPALHDALAATMERLAVEAIPIFLLGLIQGEAQSGGSPWASLERTPVTVSPNWTSGKLRYVCRFLGNWPGVCVDVGGRGVRLLEQIGSTASGTGAPPALSGGSVSFDLADGRVTYRIHTRMARRIVKLRQRFFGGKISTRAVTVTYPERDAPAASDKSASLEKDSSDTL